jgi:Protein of unknown function (DUF 659)/hAT family C-terminal dimerisation region
MLLVEAELFRNALRVFRQCSGEVPTRKAMSGHISRRAAAIRKEVVQKLIAAGPVTVAIDGWTNTRHDKVTNVIPIGAGMSYYWQSIVNVSNTNTAEWQQAPMESALQSLMRAGVRVVALATDNEAVNGKLHRLLQPKFPFLIHVPCAAHTIQLCVRKILTLPAAAEVWESVTKIIAHFSASKDARLLLKSLQSNLRPGHVPLVLLKPNDTRWSSQLRAAQRIQLLQSSINAAMQGPDAMDAIFWTSLDVLIKFLIPFQIATDIVQSDSSTLMDVYHQFVQLIEHVESLTELELLYDIRAEAVDVLRQQWKKHVNESAVINCAVLSFDTSYRRMFEDTAIAGAVKWFVTFGAQYLLRYSLSDIDSAVQLEALLLKQRSDFMAGHRVFADVNQWKDKIQTSQWASTSRRSAASPVVHARWDAKELWQVYRDSAPELAHCALALLSITASEAAVERSFSMQGTTHSNIRNRLSDPSVQHEMFIKYNYHALNCTVNPTQGSVVELDDKYQPRSYTTSVFLQPIAEDEDIAVAAAVDDGKEEKEDDSEAADEAEEKKADEDDPVAAFVARYVSDNFISSDWRWSGDRRNALESAALQSRITVVSDILVAMVRQHVLERERGVSI